MYEWKFKKYNYWDKCQQLFGNRLVSFSHRKGYYFTDHYIHDHPKYGIWQSRSSSGSAVHCAFLLGFRTIVLLGMDCIYTNGKRHFYELNDHERPVRNRPFFQRRFLRKIKENQTDSDLLEILNYWESVPKQIKNQFSLYNASPISVIKNIPKIDVGEFSCTKENHF